VRKKLTKAMNDQQLGLPVAIECQTVAQFLARWLEGTARPRLRPRTFADYKEIVEGHLIPSIGKVPLQKLAPEHLRNLLSHARRRSAWTQCCQRNLRLTVRLAVKRI